MTLGIGRDGVCGYCGSAATWVLCSWPNLIQFGRSKGMDMWYRNVFYAFRHTYQRQVELDAFGAVRIQRSDHVSTFGFGGVGGARVVACVLL